MVSCFGGAAGVTVGDGVSRGDEGDTRGDGGGGRRVNSATKNPFV